MLVAKRKHEYSSLGGLEIQRGIRRHSDTGRIIRVLLLSSAAIQNPMRKSVRYGSGVGDNEPVTWSHAGNTLSPVPLSLSFLSPGSPPLLFLRFIQLEKKKVANEGFFVDKFWGPGRALSWLTIGT
jgi:hypothetical protein